jgi:DNA-directed RNA polymerase specialized sigma24 family protein
VGIGDGDLVRLARTGDAAAFRLLVERHRAMALARAGRLGVRRDDADDIVQEAFLQAFTALDRLRDPYSARCACIRCRLSQPCFCLTTKPAPTGPVTMP